MTTRQSEFDIAEELLARAAAKWGHERAEVLTDEIVKAAASLALISNCAIPLDGPEPDFLLDCSYSEEYRWT